MRTTLILMVNLVGVALMVGCVQPYPLPELDSSQSNILVVNSFLNTGRDTIIVKLSRTKAIGAPGVPVVEGNATVTLEDDAGAVYSISQRVKGEYFRQGLSLNPKRQFRLRIKTTDQKEYQSGFVTAYVAPPIDNVSSKVTASGVDVYLDAHDPANQTHYYRWEYLETYEYTSAFQSYYIYDKVARAVVPRTPANQIYRCWKTAPSPTINVGSTVQLTQDVVHIVLLHLPTTSQKTIFKYSALVRQYAVDKAQYEYWGNVKKLSESQGSLFDPQPAEVNGNLVCTSDPSVKILGYFTAGTVTEKRFFISASELPKDWPRITDYDDCVSSVGPMAWVRVAAIPAFTGLLLDGACDPDLPPCDLGLGIPGYTTAPVACIDCTSRVKGKTSKPSYWD